MDEFFFEFIIRGEKKIILIAIKLRMPRLRYIYEVPLRRDTP